MSEKRDRKKLQTFLVGLDVEYKWKQNCFVDWLTGKPSLDFNPLNSYYTHCSSFVSSVCHQLSVPMLTPPAAFTEGLANKQYIWLETNGIENGWVKLLSPDDAQLSANGGKLVIACFHNDYSPNEGHIAVVFPIEKSTSDIKTYGVQICQAGWINTTSSHSRDVFCLNHIDKYKYYSHQVIF